MVMKELTTNHTEIKVYPFDQHVPESKEVEFFFVRRSLTITARLFTRG